MEVVLDSNFNCERFCLVFLLAAPLFLESCTQSVPIGPVYTGETSWTPAFTVDYNNYRRIGILFDKAIPLGVTRNIDSCVIQGRLSSSSEFTDLGLVSIYYSASPYGSRTSDVLEMGQNYVLRIAAYYRSGVVRYSGDTSITASVVYGNVLKSVSGSPQMVPIDFWFNGGRMLYDFTQQGWWSVDTAGSSPAQQYEYPTAINSSRFITSYPVALSGDTALFQPNGYSSGTGINVMKYNIVTGRADSSLTLENVGGMISLLAFNGQRIAAGWFHNPVGSYTTIVEYSATTGAVLDSCEISDSTISPFEYLNFAYVGNELWMSYQGARGYSMIGRLDFSTGQIVDSYENPVYGSNGLVWDGSNFWVANRTANVFEKLGLVRN